MEFDITRRNGDVYTVLVDDEDAGAVAAHTWRVHDRGRQRYAMTHVRTDVGRKSLYLHNLIMGTTGIDHVNHNGLDNRRSNLRVASQHQNLGNARPRIGGSSRFKGVCWAEDAKRWKAYIGVNRRFQNLGFFDSEEDAAAAYNRAATAAFGEFAFINSIGA